MGTCVGLFVHHCVTRHSSVQPSTSSCRTSGSLQRLCRGAGRRVRRALQGGRAKGVAVLGVVRVLARPAPRRSRAAPKRGVQRPQPARQPLHEPPVHRPGRPPRQRHRHGPQPAPTSAQRAAHTNHLAAHLPGAGAWWRHSLHTLPTPCLSTPAQGVGCSMAWACRATRQPAQRGARSTPRSAPRTPPAHARTRSWRLVAKVGGCGCSDPQPSPLTPHPSHTLPEHPSTGRGLQHGVGLPGYPPTRTARRAQRTPRSAHTTPPTHPPTHQELALGGKGGRPRLQRPAALATHSTPFPHPA